MNNCTHTYVTVELSPTAFGEIRRALTKAGYGQAFHSGGSVIDMHGLAVAEVQPTVKLTKPSISIDRMSKSYAVFNDDFTLVRDFQPYTDKDEALAEAKEWIDRHTDVCQGDIPVIYPSVKKMVRS